MLVAILLGVGFTGMWGWQRLAGNPPDGVLAESIPEIRHAIREIAADVRHVRETGTTTAIGVSRLAETVKRETSPDPRKELANMGLPWTAESFLKMIELGDRQNISLFLAGGMPATAKTDQSVVFYAIVHSAPDLEWTLSKLIEHGLDIERPLEIGSGFQTAYPNPQWKKPVFVAAFNGRLEALQVLIRLGADKSTLIHEFRSLVAQIDATETENTRMKDPEYCTQKTRNLPRDELVKMAETYCLVDLEACADLSRPDRGFLQTAKMWCKYSIRQPRLPALDWSRASPAYRSTYVATLRALGETVR